MKYLFKTQQYLFYAILIVLPFGIRHVFNFSQIQNMEGFRENISWSVYGFDILFALLLTVSLLQYFSAKEKKCKKASTLVYVFIGWIIIVSFFAANKIIAFYSAARITEAVLFFLVAKNLLHGREVLQKSALVVFAGGIFQSILAFFQFAFQKSIGLKMLGESVISPEILGVAKVEISGSLLQNIFHAEKIIRAYGTLPHPNLLGAFLLFSLVCGLYMQQVRYDYDFFSKKIHNRISPVFVGLLIILIGILLTFSRSIWLATSAFLIIYSFSNWKLFKNFLPAEASAKIAGKFKIKNSGIIKIIILICAVIAFIYMLSPRFCFKNCPNDQSFTLRQAYNKIAFQMIKNHPLLGVGPGNFTILEPQYYKNLQSWEIQPTHSLYLLIASEIGIIGLFLFVLIILKILKFNHWKMIENLPACRQGCKLKIKNSNNKTSNIHYFQDIFLIFFILFLILGFFDHYFWTLPQGQFIFWLSLAFLVAWGRINRELKEKT